MKRISRLFISIVCLALCCMLNFPYESLAAENSTSNDVPFLSLDYYTVSNEKIIPGSDFKLVLAIKNNSEKKTADNVVVNVTNPTGVRTKYGSASQVYIKSIGAGETVEAEIEFSTIEEIYTYYLDFQISMYCNDSSNSFVLRIPVGTDSPFSISNVSIPEQGIEGSTISASVAYKVIGIDNVKNVSINAYIDDVKVNSVQIGSLTPGTTKSQIISVPTDISGTHIVSIKLAYETTAGLNEIKVLEQVVTVEKKAYEPIPTPEDVTLSFLDRAKANTKMAAGIAGIVVLTVISIIVFLIKGKELK